MNEKANRQAIINETKPAVLKFFVDLRDALWKFIDRTFTAETGTGTIPMIR